MFRKLSEYPFLTTVIGWNILFFLLGYLIPDWIDLFALHYPAATRSLTGTVLVDIFRLFSYTFVHSGWHHFFTNMLWLLFFGIALHARLSSWKMMALYFGSGMIGGAFFLAAAAIWGATAPVSLYGASSAVLGICTGIIMFRPRRWSDYYPFFKKVPVTLIAWGVIILFALCSSDPYSLLAHVGGIAGGFAICFIMRNS